MNSRSTPALRRPHPRGVALLLVMIGLIVCTLLTAGFLSSQGTAIGIARNERDAEACRFLAQSGIDMCFSMVKNKSGWRESMLPGKWLNNYPIGNGTVTVTAASADGSSSFATDPTQAVIFHSTGYVNSRNFSLTGTIGPTGGGTVFRSGNFLQGSITLGNSDLLTIAVIDSYNSAVAAYNALLPGANAAFASNSTAPGALTILYPSTFKGSFTAGPNATLTSTVSVVAGLLGQLVTGPASTTAATEIRTPGTVIPPNFSTLTDNGNYTQTKNTATVAPGVYDNFTLSNGTPATVATLSSGAYEINGNLTVPTSTTLAVATGANVTLLVNGNVTIAGKIQFSTTGTLILYANGSVTTTAANINTAGSTANMQLLGLKNCTSIQLNSSTTMSGAIYAPQASVILQTGSPKFYGAVIAHDLTLKNTAQFHYDQALQSLRIDSITGGSASPGTADYSYSIAGS
jgi:hypothetical protein